jgi:cell division protein FtsB
MELVEALRALSKEHGKRTSVEIERLSALVRNLHTDNVEMEGENEELKNTISALQAKLDAVQAVLA